MKRIILLLVLLPIMGSISWAANKPTESIVKDDSVIIAGIRGLANGEISRENILKAGRLELVIPKKFSVYQYRIVSFMFTGISRQPDGELVFQKAVKGDLFTDDLQRFLKSAVIGQTLWFENIVAENIYGDRMTLKQIEVKLR